jgi:UDPglucose 6-dehydrogenase
VRETPAVKVCNMLLDDGALVHVFDPKVEKEDALREFAYHGLSVESERLVFEATPAAAAEGAHAIVVLTEWDEFKTYDYKGFYEKMKKPAFVFDGRGVLKHQELQEIGFEVHTIGKGRSKDGKLILAPRMSRNGHPEGV